MIDVSDDLILDVMAAITRLEIRKRASVHVCDRCASLFRASATAHGREACAVPAVPDQLCFTCYAPATWFYTVARCGYGDFPEYTDKPTDPQLATYADKLNFPQLTLDAPVLIHVQQCLDLILAQIANELRELQLNVIKQRGQAQAERDSGETDDYLSGYNNALDFAKSKIRREISVLGQRLLVQSTANTLTPEQLQARRDRCRQALENGQAQKPTDAPEV